MERQTQKPKSQGQVKRIQGSLTKSSQGENPYPILGLHFHFELRLIRIKVSDFMHLMIRRMFPRLASGFIASKFISPALPPVLAQPPGDHTHVGIQALALHLSQ